MKKYWAIVFVIFFSTVIYLIYLFCNKDYYLIINNNKFLLHTNEFKEIKLQDDKKYKGYINDTYYDNIIINSENKNIELYYNNKLINNVNNDVLISGNVNINKINYEYIELDESDHDIIMSVLSEHNIDEKQYIEKSSKISVDLDNDLKNEYIYLSSNSLYSYDPDKKVTKLYCLSFIYDEGKIYLINFMTFDTIFEHLDTLVDIVKINDQTIIIMNNIDKYSLLSYNNEIINLYSD